MPFARNRLQFPAQYEFYVWITDADSNRGRRCVLIKKQKKCYICKKIFPVVKKKSLTTRIELQDFHNLFCYLKDENCKQYLPIALYNILSDLPKFQISETSVFFFLSFRRYFKDLSSKIEETCVKQRLLFFRVKIKKKYRNLTLDLDLLWKLID